MPGFFLFLKKKVAKALDLQTLVKRRLAEKSGKNGKNLEKSGKKWKKTEIAKHRFGIFKITSIMRSTHVARARQSTPCIILRKPCTTRNNDAHDLLWRVDVGVGPVWGWSLDFVCPKEFPQWLFSFLREAARMTSTHGGRFR
jgi:hypothetical protein